MCSLLVLSFALWVRARSQEKARLQQASPELLPLHAAGGYGSVDSDNTPPTRIVSQRMVTSAAG